MGSELLSYATSVRRPANQPFEIGISQSFDINGFINIYLYQPCNQLNKWWQNRRVANFLDDQNRKWWLVPRQPLRGRILNGPEMNKEDYYDRYIFSSNPQILSVAPNCCLVRFFVSKLSFIEYSMNRYRVLYKNKLIAG